MSTTARAGIDITAFDRTRAAFASVNRQLGTMNTNFDRSLKTAKQFRSAFAAVAGAAGARGVWEQMGKTIDRNTIAKAEKFKDSWGRAGDFFLASIGLGATVVAVKFDDLIAKARVLAGLSPQASNDIVKGDKLRPLGETSSTAFKAPTLAPNTTEVFRQAQAIQTVNRALKENVEGYQKAEKAKREWSFDKDLMRGLDEQVALLKIRVKMFGQSDTAIDAMIVRQQALNEAIAAGHPLSEREIILLDERISMMKKLGGELDDLRNKQEDLKQQQQPLRDMLDIGKQGFADLAVAAGDGKLKVQELLNIVESMRDSFIRLAANELFNMAVKMLFQSPAPGGNSPNFNFGGLYADGGTLGAGKWGIAGEAGPEIVRGPATIVPMDRSSGGYGKVEIHNYSGAPVSQQRGGLDGRDLILTIERISDARFGNNLMKHAPLIGAAPTSKRLG